MLTGLNHLTLAVSNLERSLDFYIKLLGFIPHVRWQNGAYLSLGELWLCLSCDEAKPAQDYTHIAFNIAAEHFFAFREKLLIAGIRQWKKNRSEGESIYFQDPDGHQLEIHVGSLASRLETLRQNPYTGLEWY
ncbi:fosfomycin resistance glutathione transferase [Xenorhabdus sp. Flor]|uniref:fosfomycin resistance glutathione transferase n=1 Tax=Xenorhabdus cabanillasii TaxID=351673 RepID=UPI00199C911B|nr:fosfomycin resistance glutathione transferase [Xenorhabdus sp. Flor]MBD2815194.1 fosfomycin resistance glutathione transferase [Xenorhabdus sp. Flor]